MGVIMRTETLAPVQVNQQMRRVIPGAWRGRGRQPAWRPARPPQAAGARAPSPAWRGATVVLPTALGERQRLGVRWATGAGRQPPGPGGDRPVRGRPTRSPPSANCASAQKLEAIGQLAAGIGSRDQHAHPARGRMSASSATPPPTFAAILAGVTILPVRLANEPAAEPARRRRPAGRGRPALPGRRDPRTPSGRPWRWWT